MHPSVKPLHNLVPEVLDGFFNAPMPYSPNMWLFSTQTQTVFIIRRENPNTYEGGREEPGVGGTALWSSEGLATPLCRIPASLAAGLLAMRRLGVRDECSLRISEHFINWAHPICRGPLYYKQMGKQCMEVSQHLCAAPQKTSRILGSYKDILSLISDFNKT